MKKSKQQGFTLLELLLVVGIAAILIVAGITTYNLVNKSNQINEATRLVNTLMDQTRRMSSGTGTYVGALEDALWNTGSVPARYRGATVAIGITSPFDQTAAAVAVVPAGGGANFQLTMQIPPAYGAELAQNFNPAQSNDLVSVQVCGGAALTAATVNGNPALMSAATISTRCGNAMAPLQNLVIIAR